MTEPFNLDELGDTMLASYLRADPRRVPVLQSIMDRLDDDGAVGDLARYYVVRSSFRRAVLRGALIALGFKLPSWAMETREAADANRIFVEAYRPRYNEHRRQQRRA